MTQKEYSAFLKRLHAYLEENRGVDWQPENIFMARHISAIHTVVIATNIPADFIVTRMTNDVLVVYNVDASADTQESLRKALDMPATTSRMSRVKYELFLSRLHAYLTLTPLEKE